MGFKIGGHTVTHPENMRYLSPGALDWEIQNNKNFIEELIKKEITDFCHPGGRYDENVIEAVKRAGFKTARTTLINNTDIPADPYQIKTTIHVLPTRWEYNGKYWLDCAIAKFDEAKKKDGYFHVWGHGWEIENFNLWVDLENLFYYINKNL